MGFKEFVARHLGSQTVTFDGEGNQTTEFIDGTSRTQQARTDHRVTARLADSPDEANSVINNPDGLGLTPILIVGSGDDEESHGLFVRKVVETRGRWGGGTTREVVIQPIDPETAAVMIFTSPDPAAVIEQIRSTPTYERMFASDDDRRMFEKQKGNASPDDFTTDKEGKIKYRW